MGITASQVNELRKATGAGMMDCKKALQESNGDMEAAIDYLRKKGQKISVKRADRESNEGVAVAKTDASKAKGVVVKLSCETDFVAKNADFVDFAQQIADVALNSWPADLDGLKGLELNGETIQNLVDEQVAKIGEKIELASYAKVESDGVVAYNHAGNKIGVLVAMNQDANEGIEAAGKDVAMQIAAMNPLALDKDGISQEVIDRELAVAKEQIQAEGKPAELAEKIAMGKLNKFFKDNTLLSQPFVKDPSKDVKGMLKDSSPDLTVTSFVRVAVGA